MKRKKSAAAVYLWMLMMAWGVVSPLSALIDWRSRVDYERARGVSHRCAARSSGSGDRRQTEGAANDEIFDLLGPEPDGDST